jgi:predicted type IV restriction endonuclease
MNPLAALKEKLMVKPNIQERERVAVVIKGIKKPKIQKEIKAKIKESKVEVELREAWALSFNCESRFTFLIATAL